MPSSFSNVQRKVCCSVLYGALLAAELFAFRTPEALFSSTKISVMKLFMTDGLTGAHLRDHTTTPEVVTISNVSNMVTAVLVVKAEDSKGDCFCCGEESAGNRKSGLVEVLGTDSEVAEVTILVHA